MAAVLYMLPLPLLDVARLTVAAHSPGPLTTRVTALVAWLSVSARQQLWWWCALRMLSLSLSVTGMIIIRWVRDVGTVRAA